MLWRFIFGLSLLAMLGSAVAYAVFRLWPHGECWLPVTYEEVFPKSSKWAYPSQWGFIDNWGRMVVPADHLSSVSQWDDEGMMIVKREIDGKKLFGWIDRSGAEVIPCRYKAVNNFTRDGVAPAESDGHWGLIDRSGGVAGPFLGDRSYTNIEVKRIPTRDRVSDKWGWTNWEGELVIAHRWDEVTDFDSEEMALVREGELWGWVDSNGVVILEPRWSNAMEFDRHDMALVVSGGFWGWIDRQGKVVIPAKYSEIMLPHAYGANSSVQWNWSTDDQFYGNGLGLRDPRDDLGERISSLPAFDSYFGYAAVKDAKTGLWNFIDRNGNIAVPIAAEGLRWFGPGGTAPACKEGTNSWGWINTKGEWVIEPRWNDAFSFDESGVAVINTDWESTRLMNRDGELITGEGWMVGFGEKRGEYYFLAKIEGPGWIDRALDKIGIREYDETGERLVFRWYDASGRVVWDSRSLGFGTKCGVIFASGLIFGLFARRRLKGRSGSPTSPTED